MRHCSTEGDFEALHRLLPARFAAPGYHMTDKTAHPGYDRPTRITMTRPLGATGWVGGRCAKGAGHSEEPTT